MGAFAARCTEKGWRWVELVVGSRDLNWAWHASTTYWAFPSDILLHRSPLQVLPSSHSAVVMWYFVQRSHNESSRIRAKCFRDCVQGPFPSCRNAYCVGVRVVATPHA